MKTSKLSRIIAVILFTVIAAACAVSFAGCDNGPDKKTGYVKNESLDTSAPVTLRVAINKATWPELDHIVAEFEKIYPNCSVACEYIEGYTANLPARLTQSEQKIDVFFTVNIQSGSNLENLSLNLISDESKKKLDLSGCNAGLVANYKYTGAENTQYCIPYGGEMRGMYVNLTLLKKYNLEVPTNRAELLECCRVLKENGLVPLQSSVGNFAQHLLYPYICNSIVNGGNYEEDYAALERLDDGISEYFRDAYAFLYELVEKGYYDYKTVENTTPYTFSSSECKARDFLNVVKVADDKYEKADDIGSIAFLTDTQAFDTYLQKVKSDYHSEIEYTFITSPVAADGGCAYLSPADGIGINKNTGNLDWSLEFLNFIFSPEINTEFAELSGKIPNTADALLKYNTPAERTSDVGQMTFSYSFYRIVTTIMMGGYDENSYSAVNAKYMEVYPDETYYTKGKDAEGKDIYTAVDAAFISANPDTDLYRKVGPMIGISKANAPKYLATEDDGSTRLKFTVDDYLAKLEDEFRRAKAMRDGKTE